MYSDTIVLADSVPLIKRPGEFMSHRGKTIRREFLAAAAASSAALAAGITPTAAVAREG
jgi:hypothetical protein